MSTYLVALAIGDWQCLAESVQNAGVTLLPFRIGVVSN